ncbi:hypothetical protein [Hungatella effluvii]|uniref:hypothetical protein n=1 Tax=Hungatella effluvii TaxID=1096246 RepID=UPI002A823AA0|nr:hypothetical protein [Hungatella effluvii]
MSNTVIYTLMESLITKKYYATQKEATDKLGVYFAFNMIDAEQMTELALLAETVYAPPVEPEPEIPAEPEVPVE